MVLKDLECLVRKLRSMHLVVPGAVAHLYHIQRALSQVGGGPGMAAAVILSIYRGLEVPSGANKSQSRAPGQNCLSLTHPMGLFGASGLGLGCVWIDPSRYVCNLLLCHPNYEQKHCPRVEIHLQRIDPWRFFK